MSNYTKSTNFATKDNLSPGDPLKVVRGTEIDTEFNNISTAIATKTDNSAAAITGGSITGITDLAVADGGTGASTAAGGLNNLLPAQTGNANKYLQTDGTNATWDAVTLSTADITGTLPVANGGTGVTASTGTGSVVLSNSPTLVTPVLGTPASGTATNLTGLPISTGVSGLGTGVATFLGTPSSANLASAVTDETGSGALVFANTPTLVTPILGTPTSGTLTNATGLPIATGVSGLGSGVATFLATPSSANLAAALTDETGSGANVFATSPTLVTPILGTPTSGVATNLTGLPLTTGVTGTLPTANGGTNLTSFTSGGVVYASSTSALATGSALTFDGTNLGLSGLGSRFINLGSTSNGQSVALQISAPNSDASASVYRIGSGLTADNELVAYDVTSTQTVDKYIRGASGFRAFYANGSEGLRLTPSSLYTASAISVGIGTSSPATKLHVSQGAGTAPEIRVTAATVYAKIIADDAVEGMMRLDGSSKIGFNVDGTERARIDSSGNLLVGATTQVASERLNVTTGFTTGILVKNTGGSTYSPIYSWNATTTGDGYFEAFFTETSPTIRGSIQYNRTGGLTAYNTTSDYRAKDISGPVTGSGALIDSVPVYMGKMKGATQERPMFIAHETPAYAHTGEKDAVDKDGNPVYQQMDASALIPVMWAEIQSLRQRLSAANL